MIARINDQLHAMRAPYEFVCTGNTRERARHLRLLAIMRSPLLDGYLRIAIQQLRDQEGIEIAA